MSNPDLDAFANASLASILAAIGQAGLLTPPSEARVSDRRDDAATILAKKTAFEDAAQEIAQYGHENCSEISAVVAAAGFTVVYVASTVAVPPSWQSYPAMIHASFAIGTSAQPFGAFVCQDN